MLLHTVEQFLETGFFFIYCVTFRETEESAAAQILRPCMEHGRMLLVPGGETRQQSVLNGLEGLLPHSPTHVLIHDGARPWVSGKTIEQVLAATIEKGAAAPVVPAVNALKMVSETGVLKEHLSRERVFGVQTPQGFRFDEILAAHREAAADGNRYIDDTEIYSRYCGNVYAVPGNPENRKITYNHDLGE
jgi:2-C-methyl-D-erythritol 4-phosphate cytidylyltransferase/2-C-methyl-D-erythritol 4-phosphate cytidylyltransferase/2-C-methyl-D-erythritol 2,4-cyclodiphosphate synthase